MPAPQGNPSTAGDRAVTPADRPLRPHALALLALLRAAAGSPPEGDRDCPSSLWPAVFDLAQLHGVLPMIDRGLRAQAFAVPAAFRARLAEERRNTALLNLRNYGEFQRIARALAARGIALIPLKGLHLAELVYGDISLRPMADLDVLVPRAQAPEAVESLRELGYGEGVALSGSLATMLDTKCNLGIEHAPSGTWLEIHWSLDEPPARLEAFIGEVWRTARPGRLGDAPTLLMTPELLLLHVSAHLACNHAFAFSLRALCDVAEIVRRHPSLDWNVVVDQGRRYGWQRGVAAALTLAARHLGAAVPNEVLDRLGAAALDPVLLEEAMEHLVACVELPGALRTAPNLMAAATATSGGKAAALWKRIFVPRAELALLYGVAETSPRLTMFYAVRLKDLLRRYAFAALTLGFADGGAKLAAVRHARLESWINGDGLRPADQEGNGGKAS